MMAENVNRMLVLFCFSLCPFRSMGHVHRLILALRTLSPSLLPQHPHPHHLPPLSSPRQTRHIFINISVQRRWAMRRFRCCWAWNKERKREMTTMTNPRTLNSQKNGQRTQRRTPPGPLNVRTSSSSEASPMWTSLPTLTLVGPPRYPHFTPCLLQSLYLPRPRRHRRWRQRFLQLHIFRRWLLHQFLRTNFTQNSPLSLHQRHRPAVPASGPPWPTGANPYDSGDGHWRVR